MKPVPARIPEDAGEVASLEDVATADASVIPLAAERDEPLLANDRGLIDIGNPRRDPWRVTTLLLSCTKNGVLDGDEATDVLYDLVDEGMNLLPKVYTRGQGNFGNSAESDRIPRYIVCGDPIEGRSATPNPPSVVLSSARPCLSV